MFYSQITTDIQSVKDLVKLPQGYPIAVVLLKRIFLIFHYYIDDYYVLCIIPELQFNLVQHFLGENKVFNKNDRLK